MTGSPRFGIGHHRHRDFGPGCIVAYEHDRYVIVFKGGEARTEPFNPGGSSVGDIKALSSVFTSALLEPAAERLEP